MAPGCAIPPFDVGDDVSQRLTSPDSGPLLRHPDRHGDATAHDRRDALALLWPVRHVYGMEVIRRITYDPRQPTRTAIALAVCEALHWVKPDGAPKVVSYHVALQRMEAHG